MTETDSLLHVAEPTSKEIVSDTMPPADEKNCAEAAAAKEAGDLGPHHSSDTSSTAPETMVVAPDTRLSASFDSDAPEMVNNEKENAIFPETIERVVQLIADKPKVIAALPLVKAKFSAPCKGGNQKKCRAKGQGGNGTKRRNPGDSGTQVLSMRKMKIDIAIAPQGGVPQLWKRGAVPLAVAAIIVLVAVAAAFHQ